MKEIRRLSDQFGKLSRAMEEPLKLYLDYLKKEGVNEKELIDGLLITPRTLKLFKEGKINKCSCSDFFKLAFLLAELEEKLEK